jgi:hypothetical protein
MHRIRFSPLWLLLPLSVLFTPAMHGFLKPYRLRFEVQLYHAVPTPVEIYHSADRKHPEVVRPEDVNTLHIAYTDGLTPPLALLYTFIAAERPITGFRLDPSHMANEIWIGSVRVRSLISVATISAEDLAVQARKGHQIGDVRLEGGLLKFRTLGEDPSFLVPMPAEIGVPSMPERVLWYAAAWLLTGFLLLFLTAVVFSAKVRRQDSAAAPPGMHGVLARFLRPAADIMALAVLLVTMVQFLADTTRLDPTPLQNALARDGVGQAVPNEVREMKALTAHFGAREVVLEGRLGKGEDDNMIFQRATEYLYPVRVVRHSRWRLVPRPDTPQHTGSHCQKADELSEVALYACDAPT